MTEGVRRGPRITLREPPLGPRQEPCTMEKTNDQLVPPQRSIAKWLVESCNGSHVHLKRGRGKTRRETILKKLQNCSLHQVENTFHLRPYNFLVHLSKKMDGWNYA